MSRLKLKSDWDALSLLRRVFFILYAKKAWRKEDARLEEAKLRLKYTTPATQRHHLYVDNTSSMSLKTRSKYSGVSVCAGLGMVRPGVCLVPLFNDRVSED